MFLCNKNETTTDEKERESTLNTRPKLTTTTESETLKREWQRLKDKVYVLKQIEALGCICGILDNGCSTDEYGNHTNSVVLIEKGDIKCIPRHPNFRLFANMNPPTDYGKKNLAGYLPNHFTELYVNEIEEHSDLEMITFILSTRDKHLQSDCLLLLFSPSLQIYMYVYVSICLFEKKKDILIKAMRNGWWVILDELNLAPSEVLDALNRLLDDNRELLMTETQEVVRYHHDFIIFATQNPAGIDEIPSNELIDILRKRLVYYMITTTYMYMYILFCCI
ncbi:hypothetical protein RFI_37374 [Reticulomyxa filosa]|uniref:ATPase dynein-related AAA domain-containing protein n=1 Tax=Reticulomyxa filosa TaxID=46433 RepID=X6LH76_RETFI|nr:hypothetical protein RFI_37374 [Reticulomyxa filosa]|eukprot:ETO00085.1 hypothetical protein RFI_37374 [Reticulomyxa filosa]